MSEFRVTGDGPIGLKKFFGIPVDKCNDCGKTKELTFEDIDNNKYVYLCESCGTKREQKIKDEQAFIDIKNAVKKHMNK
tara:strand:+ start:1691 stop:1927 length:237 start_codon:yes stop_codon:yes gene_type:complete